ncbi:MAG: hypothetical protein R2713_18925 [Ilumatobacteraceae bacterium]
MGGCTDPDAPLAGHLFVQGAVDGRPFDDVHGAGWRLVTIDDPVSIDPVLGEWFAAIGGSVVGVDAADPTFGRWFDEHPVRGALQRPDFHLFGTAADATAASALLTNLRARLIG